MAAKNIDIIVLGATGFTGKCVVKHLASLTREKYFDVSWAIAGRSTEKMQDLIAELNQSGSNLRNIPVIEADVHKEDSLKKALQNSKILINCTGPNSVLSAPIVKSCIEVGTHYLDISAEIFHVLNIYRSYHKESEAANVLVIPSCGYAVLPAEAAMIYLQREFKGTLHTVQCYTEIQIPKRTYFPFIGGAVLHNGTWTSLVCELEKFKEHIALKKELFPEAIEAQPEEIEKSFFHRQNSRTWFPNPGIENDIVDISQRYLHEKTGKKYVHFKSYATVPLFFHLIVVFIMFLYYYLCYFKCFRTMLVKFPRLVTFGYVSEKGPTEKMRQDTKYYFILNGKGWGLNNDLKEKPTKSMSVKISGSDPGYDTTAIGIIMCAITVLNENSNLPRGGVIPPGAALFKTDIVDRLMHDGYSFEILQENNY